MNFNSTSSLNYRYIFRGMDILKNDVRAVLVEKVNMKSERKGKYSEFLPGLKNQISIRLSVLDTTISCTF